MISEEAKEYGKNWVKNNRDKVRASHKRYRERHALLWKELNYKYYKKNKKRILDVHKVWVEKNREKIIAYRLDPERMKKERVRRKTRHKISLVGKSCEVCGSITRLNRHHPKYEEPNNVIILCAKCHVELHKKERLVN